MKTQALAAKLPIQIPATASWEVAWNSPRGRPTVTGERDPDDVPGSACSLLQPWLLQEYMLGKISLNLLLHHSAFQEDKNEETDLL